MMSKKFRSFHIHDVTYVTRGKTAIETTMLVPKELKTGPDIKQSIIVFFHGGGFVAGDRLYEKWWPIWLLELAQAEGAIILTPDYRLWPGATIANVLDDLEAFWQWTQTSLCEWALQWSVIPDLERILCAGQSSGGRLAMQSGLLFPGHGIRAIVTISAPLHGNVPYLINSSQKTIMGTPPKPDHVARANIKQYISRTPKDSVVVNQDPMSHWETVLCLIQLGWYAKIYGQTDKDPLNLEDLVQQHADVPAIWAIHGTDDTVVPMVCAIDFAANLRTMLPSTRVLLTIQPGEHIFDIESRMSEPWMQDGLQFLGSVWQGKS